VSFASPVLSWTGNLNPGSSATITFSVTVKDPDTANHILASVITSATTGSNCATGSTDPDCASTVDVAEPALEATATPATATPGSNCPEGSTDPRCTVSFTILVPALTITKTANRPFALPGSTVGYTITVTDSGETPYTGATVTDALAGIADDAVYNNNAVA